MGCRFLGSAIETAITSRLRYVEASLTARVFRWNGGGDRQVPLHCTDSTLKRK